MSVVYRGMLKKFILFTALIFVYACHEKPSVFVPEPAAISHEKELKEPLAEDCNVFGSAADYYVRPLDGSEREKLITQIRSVAGVKYVWGGQTPEEGLDCSGLIVWAYEKLGYLGFRKESDTVFDVTSYEMFAYNIESGKIITDMREFLDYETGDFLFFDINSDGKIDHVAIFMHYDAVTGYVWIWDASTNMKGVAYRPVKNILKKNPIMGRPMMLIERDNSYASAEERKAPDGK